MVDRYMFYGEWFDPSSEFNRKFLITFFTRDGTLEMYEVRTRRIFLKRILVDGISSSDLYVGNTISVFSRLVKITDFADATTREHLQHLGERTCAIIKPEAIAHAGKIFKLVIDAGFRLNEIHMVELEKAEAEEFYDEHRDKTFFPKLVEYISSGPIIAFELVKIDAINSWKEFLGPADPQLAKLEAPQSIRAKFGTDTIYNAAHGSDSLLSAKRELHLLFRHFNLSSVNIEVEYPTCCLILPHAVNQGLLGEILIFIQEAGFKVEAIKTVTMTRSRAEEFLEVYRGVVPEFQGMVTQIASGISVAICLTSSYGCETVQKFRGIVGPSDPDIARQLRPQTIRAKWGEDRVRNGVHCADLTEDGQLEVEYLFTILPNK